MNADRTYRKHIKYADGRRKVQTWDVFASLDTQKPDKDDAASYTLNYCEYQRTTPPSEGGSQVHNIDVSVGADGQIHFGGDPEHEQVYLYPEQVKMLRKILSAKGRKK